MRLYEYSYIWLTVILIIFEFVLAIPTVVDYALVNFSWVLLAIALAHLVGFFFKSFSFIRKNCSFFDILCIVGWVLNSIPVVSIIIHLLAGLVGIYQVSGHIKTIKEQYADYDSKKAKDTFKKQHLLSDEDLVKKYSIVEQKDPLLEFLENDSKEHPNEYKDLVELVKNPNGSLGKTKKVIENPGEVLVDDDSFEPKVTNEELNWQVGLFGDNLLEDVDLDDLEKLIK